MTTHGYTADEFPLSSRDADQVTYDELDDMDDCPVCGTTLTLNRRCRRCEDTRR